MIYKKKLPLDVCINEIDQSNHYILRYEDVGASTYKSCNLWGA
jgi:hypothetical protein